MSYEFTGRRVGFAPSPGFGAVTYGDGGYVPGPFGYSGMGAVTYGRGGLVASQWPALGAVTYGRGGLIPGQWGSMGALGEDESGGEGEQTTVDEQGNVILLAPAIAAQAWGASKIWDWLTGGGGTETGAPMSPLAGKPCVVQNGTGYYNSSGVCFVSTCNAGFTEQNGTCVKDAQAASVDPKSPKKTTDGGGGGGGGSRGGASRPPPSAPPPAPPKKPSLLANPLVWVGAAVVVGGVGLVAYKGMKR